MPARTTISVLDTMTKTSPTTFTLQTVVPEDFLRQTRNASIRIIAVFALSAMALSALLVTLFGETGGNNFKWNLTGVILGVLLTSVLVGSLFRKQQWMAASLYGWRLKRSLMSITNQMHQLKAGVALQDAQSMQLLRFYHLALHHMHQLDGNSSAASELVREMDEHRQAMETLGLDPEQPRLNPEWLAHIKQFTGKPNAA